MLLAATVLAAILAGPPAPPALECPMRNLAFKHAQEMQPARDPNKVFAALELSTLCGMSPPPPAADLLLPAGYSTPPAAIHVVATPPAHRLQADGSEHAPFSSVEAALAHWRKLHAGSAAPPPLVLHAGVHFLKATMELTASDSGLIIQSAPDATGKAWLSGGQPIGTASLSWKKADGFGSTKGVYVASLAGLGLDTVPGGFTLESHERLTRARFPNADVETAQWGYDSPLRDSWSVEAAKIDHWHKPPVGDVPTFTYYDFSSLGSANPAGVVKNDSSMYTEFTTGLGGICDLWDPDVNSDGSKAGSYWCGNSSSGGWANVDNACAKAGQLQLPVEMTCLLRPTYLSQNPSFYHDCLVCFVTYWSSRYDKTDHQLKKFADWSNATGAIIHAWHSQSWALHMFNVPAHDPESGSMDFRGRWLAGGTQLVPTPGNMYT